VNINPTDIPNIKKEKVLNQNSIVWWGSSDAIDSTKSVMHDNMWPSKPRWQHKVLDKCTSYLVL